MNPANVDRMIQAVASSYPGSVIGCEKQTADNGSTSYAISTDGKVVARVGYDRDGNYEPMRTWRFDIQ